MIRPHVRLVIGIIGILTLTLGPLEVLVKMKQPEFFQIISNSRMILFGIFVLGGIYVLIDLWTLKDFTRQKKLFLTIALLVFIPPFSVPLYLWLIYPKNGQKNLETEKIQ